MKTLNKKQLFTLLFSLCITLSSFAQLTAKGGDAQTKKTKKGKNSFELVDKETGTLNSILLGQARVNRNKSILDNLTKSKMHVIVSEALVASDIKEELVDVESKKYTIFAPRDKSFKELPEGVLAELMEEGNEEALGSFAKNHVVKGEYTFDKIKSLIKGGEGRAELRTLSGVRLYILKRGSRYAIVDEAGNRSFILATDFRSRNGVIHDISDVLQKK